MPFANVNLVLPEALTKVASLWSFALQSPNAQRRKLAQVASASLVVKVAAIACHRSTASKANVVQLVRKARNAPTARSATTASASRKYVAVAVKNAVTEKVASNPTTAKLNVAIPAMDLSSAAAMPPVRQSIARPSAVAKKAISEIPRMIRLDASRSNVPKTRTAQLTNVAMTTDARSPAWSRTFVARIRSASRRNISPSANVNLVTQAMF